MFMFSDLAARNPLPKYTQEDANRFFTAMVAALGKSEAYTRAGELIDQTEDAESRHLMVQAVIIHFGRDLGAS